jgi:hypothetical protein
MAIEHQDREVDTKHKARNDGSQRLPNERDETPDPQHQKQRGVIKQAASDIEQGLVDTDLHGQRGVEKVRTPKPRPAQAQPQPDRKRD